LSTRSVGYEIEKEVAIYLHNLGYEMVEKNVRIGKWEIDLIAKTEENGLPLLVFFEIKYRKVHPDFNAGAALSAAQTKRLVRAAEMYLQQHPLYQRFYARFDVVLVTEQGGIKKTEHFKNAFIK
jgi:putative endonuclease